MIVREELDARRDILRHFSSVKKVLREVNFLPENLALSISQAFHTGLGAKTAFALIETSVQVRTT
jgi:hypothetical protein